MGKRGAGWARRAGAVPARWHQEQKRARGAQSTPGPSPGVLGWQLLPAATGVCDFFNSSQHLPPSSPCPQKRRALRKLRVPCREPRAQGRCPELSPTAALSPPGAAVIYEHDDKERKRSPVQVLCVCCELSIYHRYCLIQHLMLSVKI